MADGYRLRASSRNSPEPKEGSRIEVGWKEDGIDWNNASWSDLGVKKIPLDCFSSFVRALVSWMDR